MSASHGMRSIIETKEERLNLSDMPLFLKAALRPCASFFFNLFHNIHHRFSMFFIVLGAFSSCFHRFPLGLPRISPSVPRSQLLDLRKTSDPRQGPLIEFAVKSQQGEFFIRKARDA